MKTLIKNGHVIDPAAGINGIRNVLAEDDRIIYVGDAVVTADRTVDAAGCYVFPGIIDFHSHVYYTGSEEGINPAFFPANGITATVDSGSSGCFNYEAFHKSVVESAPIIIKSYINAFGAGLVSDDIVEDYSIKHYAKTREIIDRYSGSILGLKYRYVDGFASYETLRDAVNFAHDNGVGICVHTATPAGPLDKVADLLGKDDVYTHMYHGRGSDNILDESGKDVKPAMRAARSRGVIFDMANGNANFSFRVALPAVAAGFWPDIISTDMAKNKMNLHSRVKNLPNIMSKFLQMGMPLEEIIRAVTETPARLMRMEGIIGTLRPGARSDISIFRIADHSFTLDDIECCDYTCDRLFLPVMTMINGDIAFCAGDFAL